MDRTEKIKNNILYGKASITAGEAVITTTDGQICEQFSTPGYYELNGHYWHVRSLGDVLHVNNMGGGIINRLDVIILMPDERLKTITKEQFENELHNAIIDMGLSKYFDND